MVGRDDNLSGMISSWLNISVLSREVVLLELEWWREEEERCGVAEVIFVVSGMMMMMLAAKRQKWLLWTKGRDVVDGKWRGGSKSRSIYEQVGVRRTPSVKMQHCSLIYILLYICVISKTVTLDSTDTNHSGVVAYAKCRGRYSNSSFRVDTSWYMMWIIYIYNMPCKPLMGWNVDYNTSASNNLGCYIRHAITERKKNYFVFSFVYSLSPRSLSFLFCISNRDTKQQ